MILASGLRRHPPPVSSRPPRKLAQIPAILALSLRIALLLELLAADPAVLERDLLQAADPQALSLFIGADQLAGLDQAVVGARVLPGEAAAQQFDVQLALLQVEVVE